jgi:hypothetical protein
MTGKAFGVQSWHERLWRTNNAAAIARGDVPGAFPFAAFGERITSGSVAKAVLWETGMPAALTVPNAIQMTLVSSGTDTRRFKLVYLDDGLVERQEVITLNGTTPVSTAATDIRFVNSLYSLDDRANRTVTLAGGGVTYGVVGPNEVQFNQSAYRVPAKRRLMLTSLYAGAASSSSDARVVIRAEASFFNGDSFGAQGILHPVGGIAIQDSATTLTFGPFPIPAGEIVALTLKCDKAADILGGLFGWTEDE